MKVVACLTFVACAALTYGEECMDVSDCDHVTCPEADYTLDCFHGSCTCTHVSATCSEDDDCLNVDDSCPREWRCVEGQCRCRFGFGEGEVGPGGGGPGGAGGTGGIGRR